MPLARVLAPVLTWGGCGDTVAYYGGISLAAVVIGVWALAEMIATIQVRVQPASKQQ